MYKLYDISKAVEIDVFYPIVTYCGMPQRDIYFYSNLGIRNVVEEEITIVSLLPSFQVYFIFRLDNSRMIFYSEAWQRQVMLSRKGIFVLALVFYHSIRYQKYFPLQRTTQKLYQNSVGRDTWSWEFFESIPSCSRQQPMMSIESEIHLSFSLL